MQGPADGECGGYHTDPTERWTYELGLSLASMAKRKPTLVFLIRLWPADEGDEPAWRASLESVSTGERHGFASLDDLFAFLRQQVLDQAQPWAGKTKRL